MTVTEMFEESLARFERRRFCSRAEAAEYLDVSPRKLDELLYSQQIRSKYIGRSRKVLVASLLAYADNLPVDPPKPT